MTNFFGHFLHQSQFSGFEGYAFYFNVR